MKSDSVVLIPTYNECENVAKMIDAVMALPDGIDILIIDDNSPDGTAQIVKTKQAEYPHRLHLLERPGKQGLGRAYIAGFRWALTEGYTYITEMDCDFSHPVERLPALIQTVRSGQADLSIGSRYISGGEVRNWPLSRIAISRGASLYVRLITGFPVRDTTAGFVCYHRSVLEHIDLDQIRFYGYGFQIEMKYAAYCLGFQLVEIPIVFEDRVLGSSKMSGAIFGEAFRGVVEMRCDRWRGKFPAGRRKGM
ncbi:MAG: polyprenol monophosphomannose synthase [Porphyromonas sp.]|nr:polyprenol monophosphomannose synthase [Porphyromonas sp.]